MSLPEESVNSTLVIVDLDHTLYTGDSYRAMLHQLYPKEHLLLSPVVLCAGICRKLRLISLKRFKEISLLYFHHWRHEDIQAWGRSFYAVKLAAGISRKGRQAIQGHQEKHHSLVLATGAPDVYVQALAHDLAFEDVICTRLEYPSERFSGKIQGEDCLGEEKRRQVIRYAERRKADLQSMYVYTDHHSDIGLLELAGNPRAVNPTPQLKRYAIGHGWPVLDWSKD
jgi:HAD superfamily hydrolase (TIGR01490 family)